MARKAISVTREELVTVVNSVENPTALIEQGKKKSKGKKVESETPPVSPFTTRTQLFEAILRTEWAQKKISEGVNLNVPNLYNLILVKHKIPLLTPPGKKGRQKGMKLDNTNRKRKGRNEENYNAMMKSLEMQSGRGIIPSMAKTADRAASGSMKSAIKLKCMDCCGHEKRYVRECTSIDCALWTYRPYQNVVQVGSLIPTSEPKDAEEVEETEETEEVAA